MPKLRARLGRNTKKETAAALLALTLCGCASKSSVTLREYAHPQWGDVIRLANGGVEAILAPGRGGRLMHYARIGESNLLWTAADIDTGFGDVWGWRNWGGEKTWPWPQSGWPDGEWPPPREWEQEAFEVGQIQDRFPAAPFIPARLPLGKEVILRGPKTERRFLLSEHGTRLEITASTTGAEPFGVWSVTQIPMVEKIEVRRTAPRRILLRLPDSDNALAMSGDNTLDLAATPGGTKGMMDADAFRVPTTQGVLVVRQLGHYAGDAYDDVCRAQVYKSDTRDGDAYVELEFAAPPPAEPAAGSLSVVLSLE